MPGKSDGPESPASRRQHHRAGSSGNCGRVAGPRQFHRTLHAERHLQFDPCVFPIARRQPAAGKPAQRLVWRVSTLLPASIPRADRGQLEASIAFPVTVFASGLVKPAIIRGMKSSPQNQFHRSTCRRLSRIVQHDTFDAKEPQHGEQSNFQSIPNPRRRATRWASPEDGRRRSDNKWEPTPAARLPPRGVAAATSLEAAARKTNEGEGNESRNQRTLPSLSRARGHNPIPRCADQLHLRFRYRTPLTIHHPASQLGVGRQFHLQADRAGCSR